MKKRLYLLPSVAFLLILASILACASDVNTGDAYARRGIRAYSAGEYDSAVEELQSAVEADVTEYDLEEIYTILGNAHNELDQFDEAIAAYQRAIELNPNYYKAWVGLGIIYRLTGDLDKAQECYNTALDIEPEYAELHASLGVLYIVRGEPEKAVEALERAIELDPQLAIAHGNIALAYAMVGRFEDAEASLQQAVALGYENWEVKQERIDNLKALQQEE